MSDETKKLAWKLVQIGFWGTVISIPIGLWLIPRYKDRPWVPAAVLTAIGYGVKYYMLPHEKHVEGAAASSEES